MQRLGSRESARRCRSWFHRRKMAQRFPARALRPASRVRPNLRSTPRRQGWMEKRSLRLTCRALPARNARWSLKPTTARLRRACTFSCAPSRKFPLQDESLETAITMSVNGETRSAQAGASVADLLRELGLDGGRVAIERNLEILPRSQWAQTLVEHGDRYEIVQFVGGG